MAELSDDHPAFDQIMQFMRVNGLGSVLPGSQSVGSGLWIVANATGIVARGADLEEVLTALISYQRDELAIAYVSGEVPPIAGGGGEKYLLMGPGEKYRQIERDVWGEGLTLGRVKCDAHTAFFI
jgi:hypothetical protein